MRPNEWGACSYMYKLTFFFLNCSEDLLSQIWPTVLQTHFEPLNWWWDLWKRYSGFFNIGWQFPWKYVSGLSKFISFKSSASLKKCNLPCSVDSKTASYIKLPQYIDSELLKTGCSLQQYVDSGLRKIILGFPTK